MIIRNIDCIKYNDISVLKLYFDSDVVYERGVLYVQTGWIHQDKTGVLSTAFSEPTYDERYPTAYCSDAFPVTSGDIVTVIYEGESTIEDNFRIRPYKSDGTIVSSDGWITEWENVVVEDGCCYMRILELNNAVLATEIHITHVDGTTFAYTIRDTRNNNMES